MGLDMYLTRKTYVSTNWDKDGERDLAGIFKDLPERYAHIDGKKVKGIEEEVAYWRKANQIHAWFVREVQNGEDNCEEYSVDPDKLVDLLDICKQIKADCPMVDGEVENGYTFEGDKRIPQMEKGKVMTNAELAHKLLPTQEGFFFGGTGYDQWYMQDIENTIEQLESIMSNEKWKDQDYYYQASW